MELIAEIESQDLLGEGLVWDARTQDFIWSDILGKRLHRWSLQDQRLVTIDLPHRLASLSLTRDPKVIIAAFDRGIARFELETGALAWLHEPDLPPGVRFNDGRTGPDGRFWVGTMVEDLEAAGDSDLGTLYSLDADCRLEAHFSGIHISNGLCWSPDSSRLFHADSPKGRVRQHRFDIATGHVAAPEDWLDVGHLGGPDGAVCDAAGLYWSAIWGGSQVTAFDTGGNLVETVALPAPHVTCPCFGGPELNLLAVTTARAELSEAQLTAAPRSGNLFLFRTEHTGQPTHFFAGKV